METAHRAPTAERECPQPIGTEDSGDGAGAWEEPDAPRNERDACREDDEGQEREETGAASRLTAPLRWLGRKLWGAVKWAAKLLRAPLRPLARTPPWKLVRGALGMLTRALLWRRPPETKHGFGYWWLIGTLVIALTLGLIVAALVTPVAGIIALLVVGIWALVRRARSTGRDEDGDQDDEDGDQDEYARAGNGLAATARA